MPDETEVAEVFADGNAPSVTVSGHTLLVGASSFAAEVGVFTLSGVCVGRKAVGASGTEMELPDGFYLVKLTDAAGRSLSTKKIIVR